MPTRTPLLLLCTCLALGPLAGGCSDDGASSPDAGVDARQPPPDEPHGRPCDKPNSACPDKLGDETLQCVALKGGTPGKGYCARICKPPLENECFGVPNGLWAACLVEGPKRDAGVTKYCAFLCEEKGSRWECPPGLTCGERDSSGRAFCLP